MCKIETSAAALCALWRVYIARVRVGMRERRNLIPLGQKVRARNERANFRRAFLIAWFGVFAATCSYRTRRAVSCRLGIVIDTDDYDVKCGAL